MIDRETYMAQIRPFIDTDLVKVLTGIRRCGKSVMLELIKKELLTRNISSQQFLSYNFESMANASLCTAEALYAELKEKISHLQGKAYLFIDEIQEVAQWERCINSVRVDFNCDIYITGSNAKLLSSELATYLGGRYVEIVIRPFSFAEFLACEQKGKCEPIDIREAFNKYFERGGMPFLTDFTGDKMSAMHYLRDVYNSIILKDIVQRNNFRDVDLLERIINYAFQNIGQPFSARNISLYLKAENRSVSPNTVLNYLKACCDAYLLQKVEREDIKGKKVLSVNEKYYLIDHGFMGAVCGEKVVNPAQILENIVFIELLRRGYQVTVGKIDEGEVDFIARRNEGIEYYQVAYLLASQETITREFGALERINDNYPKYVLSMDELDMSQRGIKQVNIREFLASDMRWR